MDYSGIISSLVILIIIASVFGAALLVAKLYIYTGLNPRRDFTDQYYYDNIGMFFVYSSDILSSSKIFNCSTFLLPLDLFRVLFRCH
jgi:hypothetical protein